MHGERVIASEGARVQLRSVVLPHLGVRVALGRAAQEGRTRALRRAAQTGRTRRWGPQSPVGGRGPFVSAQRGELSQSGHGRVNSFGCALVVCEVDELFVLLVGWWRRDAIAVCPLGTSLRARYLRPCVRVVTVGVRLRSRKCQMILQRRATQ